MRILIAEDDENSRLLLESILLSLGHTVDSLKDGDEAWRKLETSVPDLVITDILMPGLDGFEICRRMRNDVRLLEVPIIVYSATYIDQRDEMLALAAGANRFVIKPIEPVKMVELIEEVVAAGVKPVPKPDISEAELDALHLDRLRAKLRRKLIELGRERRAAAASETRLRLAIDAAALGIFEWNLDSDEVAADATISELLLEHAGAIKTHWSRLLTNIHTDDRSELSGLKNRLMKRDNRITLTCRFTQADGKLRWVEMHLRRVPDERFSMPARALGVLRDVTRERSLSERLLKSVNDFDHMTRHDALTGLPNRLLFNDMLDRAIAHKTGSGICCAVLLVDLDSFKLINDSLGHAIGDALLVLLAERIRSALRPGDMVARIGSDEFAVIATDTRDREQLANIAQNLLYTLAEPTELNGETLTLSASIGIACAPADGEDRHVLLKAADTAMYAAKEQGRNRFCFHTADMSMRANELHTVEQGLKRALEQNHLRVHYQPQVKLSTGELTGLEALVRWEHPTEGMIPPGRFIPIAESSGLIEHVGRWVLRAACAECRRWIEAYPAQMRLSVNVSARQLVDERFVDSLRAILRETGFPAERLELELTESTLQLVETSPRLLNEIKSLGVSIAIDDFGTGYSSLSVLKNLPIDKLKIDRSFVHDMPGDTNDVAIVEAIIGMSRTLGLAIIAEGVETNDQLAILQKLGCEAGQGYLFSRPLPPEELAAWLEQNRVPA